MRIVRSWPKEMPTLHPYVEDACERVYIDTVNYRPLVDLEDDFIHLDWDIAVGRDELRDFASKCLADPNTVRVGPYKGYPTRRRHSTWVQNYPTQWYVWRVDEPNHIGMKRPLTPGEPFCHWFAPGFMYIPYKYWKAFADSTDGVLCEGFPDWYHQNIGWPDWPVEWDTKAVHLNFSMEYDRLMQGLE